MTRPTHRALIAALAVVPLVVLAVGGASAQLPPLIGATTTTDGTATSSSSPSSSSSTSSTTLPSPVTSTTKPEGTTTTTTTTVVPGAEPPPAELTPPGDGAPPLIDVIGAIPPWALEQMQSYRRGGGNNTKRVLEALQPLLAFGFTPEEAARVGLGKFPVAGEATFGDDWWYPRFSPEFHLHEGTDVFAAFGTPVAAPFDGVVTMGEGRVGGLYTYLTVEDGTYYYFAHLDRLPEFPDDARITDPTEVARYAFREFDQRVAFRVSAGDVIGVVGDTGNAQGGSPHVHFEVHPGGGPATNPKPILDQWLADAEAAVNDVLALYTSQGPKAVIATQRTRAAGPGQFAAPSRPLAAEILGVSSAGPGTGVQVVTEEVVRAVSRIDWDGYRNALGRPMRDLHDALSGALSP